MEHACFYKEGKAISYETFYCHVLSVRAQIKCSSFKKVMLFSGDCYNFSVCLFALLLENKQVILPPNNQQGTLAELADSCDATLIYNEHNIAIKIANKPSILNFLTLDELPLHKVTLVEPVNLLFAQLSGSLTFFTSGSTGLPKAIVKPIKHILAELNVLVTLFGRTSTTQLPAPYSILGAHGVVATVSHQHIYGLLFKVLLPFKQSLMIVNEQFEYPEHIQHFIKSELENKQDQKNYVLVSSPAHLNRLISDNVLIPYASNICSVFSSGGPLSFASSTLFNDQMQQYPIEIYGSTETGGVAWRTQNAINQPWHVFPVIRYEQLSNGQLQIYSPFIEQQPYETDDLIKSIDKQHFLLLGRADRTVKVEEKRVNLVQLEQLLCAHELVVAARVIVLKQRRREVLAAVLQINDAGEAFIKRQNKRALNELFKAQLLTQFERVCIPKKWRFLSQLPFNSQGKLVQQDLEKLFV